MSPIPPTPARRSDVKGPVPVGPVLTAIALLAPLVLGGAAQTYAADLSDLGSGATVGGQAVSIGGVEVPVPTATAVAAGHQASMALSGDGSVFTWGRNLGGQLGNGTEGSPGLVPGAVDGTGVLDGKVVTQISSANHNVALTEDGALVAWGLGDEGRLGDGRFVSSAVPVEVDMTGVLAGKRVVQVEADVAHTAVLADDGRVYTWGLGTGGALGTGSNGISAVPVAVLTSGELADERVVQIAVGGQRTLVLTESGRLLHWGWGIGPAPTEVDPSGVLAGKAVVALSTGTHASAVVDSDGRVYTWGNGSFGTLGTGREESSDVPVAVDVSGALRDERVVEVFTRGATAVARTESGRVVTWGSASYSMLGTGDGQPDALSPVHVPLSDDVANSPVVGVSGGLRHMLAVLEDGTVLAWGEGATGALGTGAAAEASRPVATAPLPVPTPDIVFGTREHRATDVVYDEETTTVTGRTPPHPGGEVDVFVAHRRSSELGAPVGRFTFGGPPEVLVGPEGTTTPLGSEVLLSASASGDAPPEVRWEVSSDGKVWEPVVDGVDRETVPTVLDDGVVVPGVTSTTLTFAAPGSAVRARAVFENALGQVTTAEAVVRGTSPPQAHLEVTPRTALVDGP